MKPNCPHCSEKSETIDSRTSVVCFGYFKRSSDKAKLQRFRCNLCLKTFSEASSQLCFGQKKRHLNPTIYELYMSGVSQRRTALLLKINYKTVQRKHIFLGIWAQKILPWLNAERTHKVHTLQFDDLETFEHSKCKPLSVIAAFEQGSQWILGFRVAKTAAKGKLSKIARQRYGRRVDERKAQRRDLFKEIKNYIVEKGVLIIR